MLKLMSFLVVFVPLFSLSCTQESQNQISRSIQNWTGTNGVLDVYSNAKVMYRFIEIDKLSTAYGTGSQDVRPYRFGYGVLDQNLNFVKDENESKVYFELSDFSTAYVFYERPKNPTPN